MIELRDKRDCCGCEACRQICPKACITMQRDEEGFLYPHVEVSRCIDCHLCEKVCPVINRNDTSTPQSILAAKNRDEQVRLDSSSGGIFTLLAEEVLRRGGAVFGAAFDEEYYVVHRCVESNEGLSALRGSKYLQSRIGNSYRQVQELLKAGREVLFTATPCQIAGLRRYLRQEYEGLLCVEVVCHGVPSPKVWQDYLEELLNRLNTTKESIEAISFRDKSLGWKNFSLKLDYTRHNERLSYVESFRQNIFMRGFLRNLYLRPSCYHCPAREGRSGADISIADFWGIERIYPHLDDDRGMGLILIHTPRGEEIFMAVAEAADYTSAPYDKALLYNPCITRSVAEPRLRTTFWQRYAKRGIAAIEPICNRLKVSLIRRAWNKLIRIIKR